VTQVPAAEQQLPTGQLGLHVPVVASHVWHAGQLDWHVPVVASHVWQAEHLGLQLPLAESKVSQIPHLGWHAPLTQVWFEVQQPADALHGALPSAHVH